VNVIGFTGSRGTTPMDVPLIMQVIRDLPDDAKVVTGGCIGADALVAEFAHMAGIPVHTILPWDRSRVDPEWGQWATTYEEMPKGTTYRDRNLMIVEKSQALIAFAKHPEDDPRSTRSGTWMTVRLARLRNLPIKVYLLHTATRVLNV
jgi:predicted Rossmann-fold nucleotide-binding protein